MRLLSYFLLLGCLTLFSSDLFASTFVGGYEGNIWGDYRNWDDQNVPGAGDEAIIPQDRGVYVNGAITVGSLILYGGVNSDGNPNSQLTIISNFSWSSGTVSVPVFLQSGCAGLWQGSLGIGANITNYGQVTCEAGITFSYSSLINYGEFDVAGTHTFGVYYAPASVENHGLLKKQVIDAGTFTIGIELVNHPDGDIVVENGELYASIHSKNYGDVSVLSAAVFHTHTLEIYDDATFTGAGELKITGNGLYANNNNPFTFDIEETSLNANGLLGSGALVYPHHFTGLSGSIQVPTTITSTGVMDINTGFGIEFSNTITNNGTLNINANMTFSAGTLNNFGLVSLNGAYTIGIYYASAGIYNHGMVKKPTASPGTFNMGIPLHNESDGDVLVQADELNISGDLYNAGDVDVLAGARLRTHGTTIYDGATFTGGGTYRNEGNGIFANNTSPVSIGFAAVEMASNVGGTGPLVFTGHLDWTNGGFSVPVTLAATCVTDMNSGNIGIGGNTTTNYGTLNVNNNFTLSAGQLDNYGLIALNGPYTIGIYYGTPGIFNHGTVKKKSGNSGIYNMGVPLTNYSDGQVIVEAGELDVTSDFTNAGSLSISVGTIFKANRTIVENGANFNGAGTYYVSYNGLTANNTNNVIFEVAEVIWQSSLGGNGLITFTQHVNWENASLEGAISVTIASSSTLDLTTNGYHSLSGGATLTNNGIMNANVNFGGGTLNNNGALNLASGINFGGGTLNNGGAMSNNAGGSVATNYQVNNTGSILVTDGTFTFSYGLSNAGTINVVAGANAVLEGYSNALETGSNLAGAGTFTVNSNLNINADLSLAIETFTLNAGSLTGTGTLTFPHTFNANGYLQSPLVIAAGGTMNDNSVILYNTLTNNGTVNCNADFIFNNDQVVVQNNGTFHLGAGVYFGSYYLYYPYGQFDNVGTVDKVSAETAYLTTHFNNHSGAVLDLQNGTLEVRYLDNEGGVSIATGAKLVVKEGNNLPGGTVTGTGTLRIQDNGWHLSSTLTINGLGLEIAGNLSADAGATLEIESAATWFSGNLEVPTNIAAGGTFDIPGGGYITLSAPLTNAGTVNCSTSFTCNADISNAGVINLTDSYAGFFTFGNQILTNTSTGTINANCNGYNYLYLHTINNGTIVVGSGVAYFNNGLENNASITLAQGTEMYLYGTAVFNIGSSVTGAGKITTEAELTLMQNFGFSGEMFKLSGGSLIGPGQLSINTAMNWTYGDVETEVDIVSGATLVIGNNNGGGGGNSSKKHIPIQSAAFHPNSAGFTLYNTITNNGTTTQNAYYYMDGGVFLNNGTMEIEYAGIYNDNGGGGTLTNNGIWNTLNYCNIQINATNNGTMTGYGEFHFDPDLTNNGVVSPGNSVGQMTFYQNYTNGSELQIEIQDNSGPGSGHDDVEATNTIQLSGDLVATETGTPYDAEYVILHCNGGTGCLTGTFANTFLPNDYAITYTGESVILTKGTPAQISPSDSTICAGNPVTLSASPADTYSWNTGETTQSIEVSPNYTTAYQVTVTVGSNIAVGNATIHVNAAPYAYVYPGYSYLCQGESVTLGVYGDNGTYLWDNGQTTQSITVSPTTAVTYYVTLTGDNGCTMQASAYVEGTNNPPATPNISGVPAAICQGDPAIYLPTYQDGYNGEWSGPGVFYGYYFDPAGLTGSQLLTFTPYPGQCAISVTWTIDVSSAIWYADADGDSYGDPLITQNTCTAPAGYVSNATDCDDTNAAVHPGATEICNNLDDDCDGQVDEGVQITYYADTDGDGYGNEAAPQQACTQPAGYVLDHTDCNDNNAAVNPGAIEICNGLDDDCDGFIDEGVQATFYADADGDGYGNSSSSIQACSAPAGYVSDNTDCDDTNAAINPGAIEICNGLDDDCDGVVDEGVLSTFYADADGDGYGNAGSSIQACSAPTGYVTDANDCNDNNDQIHPGAQEICNNLDDDCDGLVDENLNVIWYADADGDGYGNNAISLTNCIAPPGYVSDNTDCDDTRATVHPNAAEVCNGRDDDCDGQIDEGVQSTFYQDADADGYGNPNVTMQSCGPDEGFVANSGDCDDTNPNIHPGATEICDGLDNDCNGLIDNADPNITGQTIWYADTDGDGYGNASVTQLSCTQPLGYVNDANDCNDNNAQMHPGATELCNQLDDDCDGLVDEGVQSTFFADTDGDGYGNPLISTQACTAPAGYVSDATDCNDSNDQIHPGATEICNGYDDDCDGLTDEGVGSDWYADADGDGYGNAANLQTACTQPAGYVANSEDCDDQNAFVHPGAAEVCNNLDDDCDGQIDEGDICDGDGDGYTVAQGDCNDNNPAIHPNAVEVCNNLDDDCDGLIDENVGAIWYADADGDGYGNALESIQACTQPSGYVANADDCDDSRAMVHPGAPEVCNNVDDDCDGLVDETNLSLSLSAGNILCNGGTTVLTATATGGIAPYQYSLDGDAFGNSNNFAAGAGNHTVTAKDANGCEATNNININQPSAILIDPIVVTHIACGGGNTGAVDITVTGGTPGYSYHWSNNRTTQDLVNVAANIYTVAVTDSKGCIATASATVNPKLKLTLSKTNTRCNGGNDGTATATATGGAPGYTYDWNTGANTPTITGLSVGTYTCTITDALGCTRTGHISVGQPSAIGITGIVSKVTCNGSATGAIAITISNGVAPFSYAWSDGATTEDRSNLVVGTYTLLVTDNNGCTREKTFSVTQPAALTLSFSVSNVSCNGTPDGEITANVGGGTKFPTTSLCNGERYCFSWSHGDNARVSSGLSAGIYTVTVTDANGCSITGSATVTEPTVLEISNVQVTPLDNGKYKLTVTANGGTPSYKYKRIPGGGYQVSNVFNNVPAGTYTMVVRDKNLCEATTILTVGGSGKPGGADERKDLEELLVMDLDNPVLVFPNPTTAWFQVQVDREFNSAQLSIFNAQGQLMVKEHFEANADLGAYEVNTWESGLYLVVVELDGKRFLQKLMVAGK